MLFRRVSRRDVYVRRGKRFAGLWWLLVMPLCVSTARGQYHFDYWTADTGLPQNSVYSIIQTRDGYLWLTTFDGLVRFDGVRFTVFNKGNSKGMKSNRFLSLFAEADDTLWLGTEDGGLVRFRNGRSQTFTTADGLPSNHVGEVQKDLDGSLLVSTAEGLARWREGRITVERRADNKDYKIYVSPANVRWEIDVGGLRRTQDGRATNYALPFDSQRISSDRTFNYLIYVRMVEDRDGALWLAASGNVYRMKDGAVTTYTAADGVPPSLVRDMVQDRHGDIWLATRADGICRLNANRFACYDTTDGLSSNYVDDLFEDREGTLWAGTNERGINRLTRQAVTPLSTAHGLVDKNVYPLLEDHKGSVWIGSSSALSQYKDGKVTNYTRRDGLLYEIVQSLHEDRDGRLWVGSIGGVGYYEEGKFTDFTERLGLSIGDVDIRVIRQDRHGALWFGTGKGLIRYQDGVATRYTTENGLPSNDVKVIHEARDGSLWIGTYGGVAKMSAPPVVLTEHEGLASNHVRAIAEDAQGTLWIGTYDGGLSRFAGGKFVNYTTQNGLYSNGVFQILDDGRGWFWMSSNQGIYRVSRQQLEDFAAGRTAAITSTAFGKPDGMLNAECNGGRQPAGIKTRDGKLWFPTQDGVAIIDPETMPVNPQPPPVVIESAWLEGGSVPLSGSLKLAPHQDNLEIRYTGLSFIKPEQIRFRYRLEGLDKSWTEAGARRSAYYPYLPPGRYTFRVIAANSDNVWNEGGAALEIVVLPPFYQTWWFVALVSLGVVGAAYLVYEDRVSRMRRAQAAQQAFSRQLIVSQESERKRIAAELHDSLGQRLVVINNLALMCLQSPADNGEAHRRVEEISAEASQAIGEVREISYNLRPYKLDRIGLTRAVEAMIRAAAAASGIVFTADVDQIDDAFPKESEINFYRIVQESLNNIVKHAHATEAGVTIRRDGNRLVLTIRDNGKGFTPGTGVADGQPGGFGLLGISERAQLLGGRPSIHSAPGQGTTISIAIDLRGNHHGR
jgi:ligand-binding sensor domain-containing protein/signal transduction histidine kinase